MKNPKLDSQLDSDIFFTMALLEYIARKTNNKLSFVIQILGEKGVAYILECADVLHSLTPDHAISDLLDAIPVPRGKVKRVRVPNPKDIPTIWVIGSVYRNVWYGVTDLELTPETYEKDVKITVNFILTLSTTHSFLANAIEDYNSAMFYSNPDYLIDSYKAKKFVYDGE